MELKNRIIEKSALVGIALAVVGLFSKLGTPAYYQVFTDVGMALEDTSAMLVAAGLYHRRDVVIEINGRDVGRGFSRRGCDGLLLVAPLPQTAQGWPHLLPKFDPEKFEPGYLYDGKLHRRAPRLARLENRLRAELSPGSGLPLPPITAMAESGSCDLIHEAAAVLAGYSRGHEVQYVAPAPTPEEGPA